MQSRQARSDPSLGIVIPNSSSALILLWLFLHLHLFVFFSTSLQDYWWNWNGWFVQTQKMFPFITCEISLCQYVCESGVLVSTYLIVDLGVPNWFDRITNQEQLCGSWKHVSLQGFFPLWSSWSLLRCLQSFYSKASSREECAFEEIKSTLSRSSICPWIFLVGGFTGLSELDLMRVPVKNCDDQIP